MANMDCLSICILVFTGRFIFANPSRAAGFVVVQLFMLCNCINSGLERLCFCSERILPVSDRVENSLDEIYLMTNM